MVYKNYDELTILNIPNQTESVSYDILAEAILKRPSNMIYCEADGKLFGIISMGDIERARENELSVVPINRSFTRVTKTEYMKAREIFREKEKINALPVVDETGSLLGDYSRWDDSLCFFESMLALDGDVVESLRNREDKNKPVIFVRSENPSMQKQQMFDILGKHLESQNVEVVRIDKTEVADYLNAEWLFFVDEDELRGIVTLLKSIQKIDLSGKRFTTCNRYVREHGYKNKCDNIFLAYLKKLEAEGVSVMNLRFCEENDFYAVIMKQLAVKYEHWESWNTDFKVHPEMEQDFYGELYTEEYARQISSISYSIETKSGTGKLKDYKSQYYNVTNGERHTEGQPKNYDRTIYFFGPCLIYGYYVEDKYTIASLLQKRLNELGYRIKVVNCGSSIYYIKNYTEEARILSTPFKKGDCIVLYFFHRDIVGINSVDLLDTLQEHNVNPTWFTNWLEHCNHKVNSLYADAVFDALRPILDKLENEQDKWKESDGESAERREESFIAERNPMDGQGKLIEPACDFVKILYLDRYFADFEVEKYRTIGSIVMNCNPFTYGHRYLIEQAVAQVDFLIIFVVEEDKSVFKFDERFACVYEGTRDLENVKVVPSGPFILSQTSFPEYFIKEADEDVAENAENDIRFFAEHIAPHLHITHRFVGEEPEDVVTSEYNLAMKRILPKHGIKLVEIPRKENNGTYISASRVRKCLDDYEVERLKELVPDSTMQVLGIT